ncbi:MAG: hypothetical protein NTZ58_01560 [Solirubrobacterales bacterium]|nr:hypothetical protein [Solirubrobacterales bacterium]
MSSTLAADEARPTCSEAERLAAEALAEQLLESGRLATIQPFWAYPRWWLAQAICSAGGVLASVLCVGAPLTGLIVAVVALVLSLIDGTRLAPLRRLTGSRASQNVISPPHAATPKLAVTLILTASVDDRPTAPSRFFPASLIATNAACIALVAACAGLRLAGIDALPIAIVQLIPTLLLLAAILVFLERGTAAAVSDRSATDAVLEIAARFDEDPPENLAVAIVFGGAGSAQAAGLRFWLRSRRKRGMKPADVAILDIEPCSDGAPSWWQRDGIVVATGLHPQLRRAAKAAAASLDCAIESRGGTDATAAGVARGDGWPAIAIGSRPLEQGEESAPDETFAVVADLGEQLIRELDRELGRASKND